MVLTWPKAVHMIQSIHSAYKCYKFWDIRLFFIIFGDISTWFSDWQIDWMQEKICIIWKAKLILLLVAISKWAGNLFLICISKVLENRGRIFPNKSFDTNLSLSSLTKNTLNMIKKNTFSTQKAATRNCFYTYDFLVKLLKIVCRLQFLIQGLF